VSDPEACTPAGTPTTDGAATFGDTWDLLRDDLTRAPFPGGAA
jgi:hypothetical protein